MAKKALSELERGKSWPVYFLYGEEPFKIHEFVEKVHALLFKGEGAGEDTIDTFCVDRLDGASVNGNAVLEAIQSLGLFGNSGGRRLVIVRQAQLLKEVDALSKTLMDSESESPWGDSILILIADSLDGRKKFHQWLKKKGYALEFTVARDAELAQWVQYLVRKRGVKVSPQAAQMLAIASDGSLYRLAQEIDKAWLYSGAAPGVELLPEHVAAVSSMQVTHEMVELVQAVLENKRTRGLLLAEKLIRSSEDAIGFVGFLNWSMKRSGKARLLRPLLDLDSRLKGSGVEARTLVEQFIVEQTAPRE